jgi:hypothetical protein
MSQCNVRRAPHDNHALTGPRAIDNLGRESGPTPRTCGVRQERTAVVDGAEPGTGRVQQYRTIFVRQIDALH